MAQEEQTPAQEEQTDTGIVQSARLLIISLVAIVVVPGLALVMFALNDSLTEETRRVNHLEGSNDTCVECHTRTTPGIVEQYGHSTMAGANVSCSDCHEVASDYPDAIEHEGTYVLNQPTTAMCATCHANEVNQYNQSRHGLPAFIAYNGTDGLTEEQLAIYEAIAEGGFNPDRQRNALFALEGDAITEFACKSCHDIGKPAADESIGQCQSCHLRHEFSLEQARRPETCNACHIGPDHPQFEIYTESPHGIAYATGGDDWNWDAEPGTLTVTDFPAPTCATCHLSGFGGTATTHDVGERLTWFLFAPVSEQRPNWQENQRRMQSVCMECHNQNFVEDFYVAASAATEQVNAWVEESNDIIAPLIEQQLLTDAPFDEPIDFTYFELWHHWGRTAKFGVWMQGADYVQWHGAYEVLSDLAELREMVDERLAEAQAANAEAGESADAEGDVRDVSTVGG